MEPNFTPVLNEVTGKTDFNFPGKLISLGSKELENSNGKKYVVGTIEFITPAGEKVQRSAQIYKASLDQGIEVGRNYLSTASQGDNGEIYIRTSHLVVAERAKLDDFGSLFAANVAAEAGDMA